MQGSSHVEQPIATQYILQYRSEVSRAKQDKSQTARESGSVAYLASEYTFNTELLFQSEPSMVDATPTRMMLSP